MGSAAAMKFVLVNHRTPAGPSKCIACSTPLASGYLRDVSSHRPYCGTDCYHRDEAKNMPMPLFMAWLAANAADLRPAMPYPPSLELFTSFAAASCWCSLSFAKAALRMSELMAAQAFDG
jgi:hypothetical protein